MPLAALACPVLELDVTKSGTVERSRPLLGTFVQVMVSADDRELAHERVEAAFAAVANLHSLLSFHLPTSDISRLNREAAITPVRVSDHTYEVIRLALEIAAASAPGHVSIEFVDQAALFGQGNELARAVAAQFGVVPAHQGFCAANAPGLDVHLGLPMQGQLATFDGIAQAVFQGQAASPLHFALRVMFATVVSGDCGVKS